MPRPTATRYGLDMHARDDLITWIGGLVVAAAVLAVVRVAGARLGVALSWAVIVFVAAVLARLALAERDPGVS